MATAKRELTDLTVQGPRPTGRAGDELLTLQQVAELLEVSTNTVYYWRYQGTGPKGHRVGRQVRYWKRDVLEWLQERADRRFGLPTISR